MYPTSSNDDYFKLTYYRNKNDLYVGFVTTEREAITYIKAEIYELSVVKKITIYVL